MAIKKIERVNGCWAKAEEDEPLFVLKSTDPIAPIVVRSWAAIAALMDVRPEKCAEARKLADQMDVWRAQHKEA